jgi:hypothetical protein
MTDARLPIGARREQALVTSLDEIRIVLEEFQEEFPNINDQRLRPAANLLIDISGAVLAVHRNSPKPSIADDLAGLMSAVRALKIPARDPDLGRTPTLDRLRSKQGLMIAGLAEALEAAAAMGLRPQQPALPQELAAEIPRSEIEGLLRGILRRLSQIDDSLDALKETQSAPTEFKQQTGLVNFYSESMRAETDLVRLQIDLGENTIDFSALTRAVEAMANLTRDFVETARAWTGRIAPVVIRIAEKIPVQVKRVARGLEVTAMRVVRLARGQQVAGGEVQAEMPPSSTERWKGIAESGSAVAAGLDAIAAADANFDAQHFITGARAAYEMIVITFAEGDRRQLRNLLSREVFDGFDAAITERENRGETAETRFVSIDGSTITAAELRKSTAQITVRFVSKLVSSTRDRNGTVIDGNAEKVTDVTDVWTFARDVSSRDPNWKVVATEAGQ